ncbi:hypothetical protein TNCV_1549321 [Trichonephila clavipes]|nr:hypothetical protein TNCV_1549321 [Trichonephila clavipes]
MRIVIWSFPCGDTELLLLHISHMNCMLPLESEFYGLHLPIDFKKDYYFPDDPLFSSGAALAVLPPRTKMENAAPFSKLSKTPITHAPFWIAETGHRMGERNVRCDPTPGRRESYW